MQGSAGELQPPTSQPTKPGRKPLHGCMHPYAGCDATVSFPRTPDVVRVFLGLHFKNVAT
jgi:hypothetical protein